MIVICTIHPDAAPNDYGDCLECASEGHDSHEQLLNGVCRECTADFNAARDAWGHVFAGQRRLPHVGDPDEPMLGTCRNCGPDHMVIDGICDAECETCAIGVEDGEHYPCAFDARLAYADSEPRRVAL